MIRSRVLLLSAAVLTFISTTAAHAQGSRPALVDSARALIDDFNERQSIELLRRALNPAIGAPDASWARGVQLLGQTLLQTNQREEAVAWLRWALRLSPTLQVDSVNFTPALVNVFLEARAFVAQSRTDPRVSTQFEWSTSSASGGLGDLRVARGEGGTANLLQASINGEFIDEGRPRRLSPGSHQVAVRTAGQTDAEITTEVLPGVTTQVTVNFVTANAGLSQTTERLVLSRLVRVDRTGATGSDCKIGFLAGSSGLLITRYSSLLGDGQPAVRLANSTVSAEPARVAAYDFAADLAVLSVTGSSNEPLPISIDARAGTPLWATHFPSCGDTPSLTAVTVTAATRDSITLAQDTPGAEQWGVLVNESGAVAGLLTGPRSARMLGSSASLLAKARANVAAGRVLTTLQAAQEIAAQTRPVAPSVSTNVADGPPRKRRSMKLPIIGGVVVGGLVAALAMPKSPSKPTTGGIVIRLP